MEPLPNQPRECKFAPTSLTQEKLNELRQEIARKGVSKNPLDYEHPETKFDSTHTLSDVLGKIFGKRGHGIPQGTAERIELALLTNGVDFSKLKADHWKVEGGKLIFLREENGQKRGVFSINLLPWKALEVKPESKETLGSHYYDLGVYKGAAPLSREARTIEGSVDATAHYDKLRKSPWYKEKKETAELLLKIFDGDRTRFTPQTIAVIQSKESILRALASQTDFTPSKFCKNFEKKYTFDQIAGAYGVYNIVLSFQRVLDLYGKNPDALQNDKTQIALSIGTHVKFQEERYAKAYAVTREEPGIDEPAIVCPPEDTTGPPGPPPPGPPPPGPPKPPPIVWPSPEAKEDHLRTTLRPGELARTAEQFDERTSPDIMSDALIRGYTTYGINAFLEGINKIPPDKRATVLDNVFKSLGEEDPARAENLIQEIVFGMRDNLKANVTHAIAENIDRSTGDEKKVWELQQMLFEQQEAGGDPEKLKLVFEKLDSINPNNLPPELKEMYETQKRTLEFFVKRSVGTDLVESALAVLESTLPEGDKKDIQKLSKKSDDELRKALRNEGATEWLDNDEEVYLASAHVLEALRLAIFYVYPEHIKQGYKIDNPVSYYYHWIKTGKLTEIVIPKDYPPPVVADPLGRNCVSGNRIDLNKLFIDLDSEIRLFEKYQSGKESLGEHSIWNLYEGNAGAFLGEDISEAGLIHGSDKIFKQGHLFERGGELGVSEKVYMARIKNLMALNRNDEARDLCIAVLEKRLAEEKPLPDAEIEARADELSKDYMTKIRAQARLELEAQGIKTSADVKSKNMPRPAGGVYTTIDELITDVARDRLEERAYIELQSGIGEQIFDADKDRSNWSAFENSVFDEFKELNGYGFFDIREETASLIGDISKVVAEIVVIELATAGVGAFVAGAAGAARVGVYGHRGLDVAHASRTTERAARLGGRFGRTKMGRPFGRLARPVQYLQKDATWHARGARTLLHSATFVEAQAALHGEVVNPASKEGAFYIGTMALTFWGLDKVQQFMRGGLASGIVAQQAARGGPAPTAIGRLGERLNPVLHLGRLSNWVGSRTRILADRGIAGYAGMSAMEYATEVAALQYLGSAETYLAVQTGMISTVEAEAMEEPEKARQWAHTAAVVLGLRTWRHVQRRLMPPPEPPPPTPPPPPPPEGPRLLGPGRSAHDVDIIANNISKIRDPSGFPRGKVQVGDRFYNLNHALRLRAGNRTLKSQYEEASRMPEGEQKIQELMRLDRLAASRLILASGGDVEYKTRAEAEQARDALLAEYPRRGINFYERDGKTYLTIWKAHPVDWRTPNPAGGPAAPSSPSGSSETPAAAAAAAETPAAAGAAAAAAPSAGPTASPSRSARRGKEAHVDEFAYAMAEARSKGADWIPRGMKIRLSEFDLKIGDKTLADLYEGASKLPDSTPLERNLKIARFAEIDRFAAERILVSRNQNVEYRTREQAEQALTGLTRDFPERLFVIEEVSGKVLLKSYEPQDVQPIAHLISENRYNNGVAGAKGIPDGTLQIGKNNYSLKKGMGFRAGEKTLREQYEEALNITDKKDRDDRLMDLDWLLASRMIVQNGMAARYRDVDEVGRARTGISKDFPRSNYEVVEHDGKPVLYRRG